MKPPQLFKKQMANTGKLAIKTAMLMSTSVILISSEAASIKKCMPTATGIQPEMFPTLEKDC